MQPQSQSELIQETVGIILQELGLQAMQAAEIAYHTMLDHTKPELSSLSALSSVYCGTWITPHDLVIIHIDVLFQRWLCTQVCLLMSLTARLSALLQARQREEAELERQAERLRKLEARQRLKEEAAVKALSQQLLAHQVCAARIALMNHGQLLFL